MNRGNKKWIRYFAVFLAFAMIIETFVFAVESYEKNGKKANAELGNQDNVTAAEISNMTGVKLEEILKLREEGKNWNEILEILKSASQYKAVNDDVRRKETLAQSGISEECLKKLRTEGYTEEEIIDAKTLVERILFQLEEITNMRAMLPVIPAAGTENEKKQGDTTAYIVLAGKINLEEAISLMLKLRNEFGNMQGVLDEYLCALQLDISLEEYLADKEKYERDKQRKLAETAVQDIITVARIEEKTLELLQNANEDERTVTAEIKANTPTIPEAEKKGINPLPDIPVPGAETVKPQNPADAVMKEINSINPNGI